MRYYAFIAGAVAGPYEAADLVPLLQPDLQVCPEGEDAWGRAAEFPELAAMIRAAPAAPPVRAVRESPPEDLAPKLQELWRICRASSDDLLQEQRIKNWKEYFAPEREIILAELKRRSLA